MNRSPVTQKPYLNDAIIGDSSMLVALGRTGEIYRLWWPHVDMPQHIEQMRAGIYFMGESTETSWLDAEQEWTHEQSYLENTNVLVTKATAVKLPLVVTATDFVVPDEDLLVRDYLIQNTSAAAVSIRFFYYASLTIEENQRYNTVMFEPQVDGLVYFRRNYAFTLASANVCNGYTASHAFSHAAQGYLPGNKIAMTPDGAIVWELSIAAGEAVRLPIYLSAGTSIEESQSRMLTAKSKPVSEWLEITTTYWRNYLTQTNRLPFTDAEMEAIYNRSLLVFKLMADKATGTVIAAPEFDEAFTRCGGYAYAWGRDAAYITTAFDKAGLTDLSRSFYRFAIRAQDGDGAWQQRHYHDGSLAPSWGLQIDEGASILWGMYQHYVMTQDRSFLNEVWVSVVKGASFLLRYLDQETGLPLPSRDLWEEREAEHTYSAAAVYGGLKGAASIASELGHEEYATVWNEAAEALKGSILTHTVDETSQTFYRGVKLAVDKSTYLRAEEAGEKVSSTVDDKGYVTYYVWKDDVYDISLVGLSVPFSMLDASDPRMNATADAIERTCTSPVVGGIRRYEDDIYVGGNPWILTTLWMAQFRIQQGKWEEAKQHLNWAVAHATSLHLLPEQIDKKTGETAWVVPLTWSHAMYVLTVHMLHEAGQL